jgi:DNA invertase Pin-like site-specific DNA recombinase
MKLKRKPKRTAEEVKELAPKLIKYYFDNPHANAYDIMVNRFKVSKNTIRRILSAELDKRFMKKHNTHNNV